jgi:hypothetical protein
LLAGFKSNNTDGQLRQTIAVRNIGLRQSEVKRLKETGTSVGSGSIGESVLASAVVETGSLNASEGSPILNEVLAK